MCRVTSRGASFRFNHFRYALLMLENLWCSLNRMGNDRHKNFSLFFSLSRALEHALQHLRLRVSGFHVLPPFGPNMICKYRPGTTSKHNSGTSRTSKMRTHKINTDKTKPFQCQKCGRGFTLKRNKDRHVNYECGHEPRFQCPYCGLRSKQTSPVYAHIRKKHPEEEVFIFDMKLWARRSPIPYLISNCSSEFCLFIGLLSIIIFTIIISITEN